MKVQIEVGKGIQCDGIEIMFGDSISFVVEAYGEIDRYEDNYYFYESSLLVHVDSNNCIDEIEIRNDEEHSHVVMLNGTNIFSEMKDVVIELIVRLNQSPVEDELGTYEAKRIGLAYSFSMTDEKIEEMISEAKEEGTYEEMKEEIEADIKRAPNPVIYKNAPLSNAKLRLSSLDAVKRSIFIYYRIWWFVYFFKFKKSDFSSILEKIC